MEIIIILSTAFIIIVSLLLSNNSLKKQASEQSQLLFLLYNKTKTNYEDLYEFASSIKSINNNIQALSSSLNENIKRLEEVSSAKIMPSPQLAEMITTTIREQITIEMILTKNQRIVKNESVKKIIDNVVNTYQHVNVEYITKKCLAIIESEKNKSE